MNDTGDYFEFKYDCLGDVRVTKNGKFYGTYDTIAEALKDIKENEDTEQ